MDKLVRSGHPNWNPYTFAYKKANFLNFPLSQLIFSSIKEDHHNIYLVGFMIGENDKIEYVRNLVNSPGKPAIKCTSRFPPQRNDFGLPLSDLCL